MEKKYDRVRIAIANILVQTAERGAQNILCMYHFRNVMKYLNISYAELNPLLQELAGLGCIDLLCIPGPDVSDETVITDYNHWPPEGWTEAKE
jgi:hypothetical protein